MHTLSFVGVFEIKELPDAKKLLKQWQKQKAFAGASLLEGHPYLEAFTFTIKIDNKRVSTDVFKQKPKQ